MVRSPVCQGFVDLHVHSCFSSDGQLAPDEIFRLAKSAGAVAIAISDHDTVAAASTAERLADVYGVQFVPSVEISTTFNGRYLHLLAHLVDWRDPSLKLCLMEQEKLREAVARERIDALVRLGFDLSYEEVSENISGGVITGPAIAQFLLSKQASKLDPRLAVYLTGEKSDRPAARFYEDYLAPGRPAYVPKRYMDIREAIRLVRAAGGVPTLAHPGADFARADEQIVALLKGEGLEAIEVFSSYHDASLTELYLECSRRYELIASAGSDFHGKVKPHVAFGSVRARGHDLIDELKLRRKSPHGSGLQA